MVIIKQRKIQHCQKKKHKDLIHNTGIFHDKQIWRISFLESIEYDFIKALMIPTDNQIVTWLGIFCD